MKEELYCDIDEDGTKLYYKDVEMNILPRTDGPAIEYYNGAKEWCIDGNLHRVDGPAVEYSNGDTGWYLNGKLHREGGPAVEYSNGTKVLFFNG